MNKIVAPLAFALGGLAALVASARAPAPLTLRQRYQLPPLAALDPPHAALILVDAQREFVDGGLPLSGMDAATSAARSLLAWARARGLAVVHVRQVGKAGGPLFAPGGPGAAPIAELDARPGEEVVEKTAGGGFTGTDLDGRLRARGIDTVIVAGFMTHHAVDMTVRDAGVRGYRVLIAADATATRDLPGQGGAALPAAEVQRAALAILGDRYAEARTVAEVERLLP